MKCDYLRDKGALCVSPLAEGRELKFIYAAIMSAVAIVAPRGGA